MNPLGISLPSAGEATLEVIADERKPDFKPPAAKPFVKWVGGKRSIIDTLLHRIPKRFDRYVEPFVGGGSLFFALNPKNSFLSDINFRLMITYKAIAENVDGVIDELEEHRQKHDKTYYYQARKRLSEESDDTAIAGLFIYLNKTCYNGLYRVNKDGGFNVPFGKYTNPKIVDADNLKAVAHYLEKAQISHLPFHQCMPRKRDFFYFDPPYHSTYDQYSPARFEDKEHERLAQYAKQVDAAQGFFLLSNSDTPLIRELYEDYTIEVVSASRSVSCKANQRGKEGELLIRNY